MPSLEHHVTYLFHLISIPVCDFFILGLLLIQFSHSFFLFQSLFILSSCNFPYASLSFYFNFNHSLIPAFSFSLINLSRYIFTSLTLSNYFLSYFLYFILSLSLLNIFFITNFLTCLIPISISLILSVTHAQTHYAHF